MKVSSAEQVGLLRINNVQPSFRAVVPGLGSLDVLVLKPPEACSTSCAGQDFWGAIVPEHLESQRATALEAHISLQWSFSVVSFSHLVKRYRQPLNIELSPL